MGTISELSDDLLIKILSYLPTKVAVSTSVLSKNWQFLWMWLPNLEFSNTHGSQSASLQCFLLRNLPLYRAPVIETFRLDLFRLDIDPEEEVKLWVQFAVSRDVRVLHIFHFSKYGDVTLPSSLYTCKSLVTLELIQGIFMDVPHVVCLPSLKNLRLDGVTYDNKDPLPCLLSNCPVLEVLSVSGFGQFGKMIIRVPSLQRLSLDITDDLDEFVIDTPSLEHLDLDVHVNHVYYSIKNMPKLKEALLDVSISLFVKLIGSIPSVKRLTLCLSFDYISEVVLDDGVVLSKLKHLKLCMCPSYSAFLLLELLKVSPNLRVLELFTTDGHGCYMYAWNQPSTVPECILSSLETFKWSKYEGSKEQRELVIYILQNARRLKTATILLSKFYLDKTLDLKKEFALFRSSTTCHLVFH